MQREPAKTFGKNEHPVGKRGKILERPWKWKKSTGLFHPRGMKGSGGKRSPGGYNQTSSSPIEKGNPPCGVIFKKKIIINSPP